MYVNMYMYVSDIYRSKTTDYTWNNFLLFIFRLIQLLSYLIVYSIE